MKNLAKLLLLLSLPAVARAAPVTFDHVTYQTSALARAGIDLSAVDGLFPGDDLPLMTATDPVASADATAGAAALADVDTFVVIAETVGGIDADAEAIASVSFFGEFISPGRPVRLTFDFDNTSSAMDGATGEAILRVLLLADDQAVVDVVLAESTHFDQMYEFGAGATGRLHLDLVASSYAPQFMPGVAGGGLGSGVGSGQGALRFSVNAVPEPPGWALFALMTACIATGGRAKRRENDRSP